MNDSETPATTPAPSWPTGVATGVGSMPGTDVREAVRTVVGELPDLPHLPELPARGPGADLTGRGTALLVELYAQVVPSGWRFADRPGRDTRRAAAFLREDLDALEEFTQGYRGPLKVQVAGPWTLAATIELAHGDKALADPGACRDIVASLAEGVRLHVAELRRRFPRSALLLQLDEPALPGVLAGTVPTASGFGRLRSVERSTVRDGLSTVVRAAGVPVAVHCCAPDVPMALLRQAGASALSLDVRLLPRERDEEFGEEVEAGTRFLLGLVPATPATRSGGAGSRGMSDPAGSVGAVKPAQPVTVTQPVSVVTALWRRLGFRPEGLAETVAVTPSCGLAGADPRHARQALARSVEAARVLVEAPEVADRGL